MAKFGGIEARQARETAWAHREYHAEILICSAIAARLCLNGAKRDEVIQAFIHAKRNNTSFVEEILIYAGIRQEKLYEAIAGELGVIFEDRIVSSDILLREDDVPQNLRNIRHVLVAHGGGRTLLYIAPTIDDLVVLKRSLASTPSLVQRLRVCPPATLAQIMRLRQERELAKIVQEMTPAHFSAAQVVNGWQGFALAEIVSCLIALLLFHPMETTVVLHIGLTLVFFCCVTMRLFASVGRMPRPRNAGNVAPRDMPVYSILVPLYHEAAIVPQLLRALSGLQWPASKLDIKLVCEADDALTIAAIEKQVLPPFFEVVKVPRTGPRTKPKALNYALQFARGEFVVVYDAEDRPHPDQLMEAWSTFRAHDGKLACLQAPLLTSNFRSDWLTRMFAFEYAALFRGLLPWMARMNFVIPLGGTSNHLRRECLERVGGWDSHNVTEDADLGLRLARFGYSVGVISRGTWEDAPRCYTDWNKQRTRWLKGWMQTWLVHMRNPWRTCRELGAVRFAMSMLYMSGLILSALFYPLMLVTVAMIITAFLSEPGSFWSFYLLCVDGVNVALAWVSYYVLGLKTLSREERRAGRYFCWIPVYWILISFSAWRAVWQLFHAPHLWEKTPHHPSGAFAMPHPVRQSRRAAVRMAASSQKLTPGTANEPLLSADRLKGAALAR